MIKDDLRQRLTDSIETALRVGRRPGRGARGRRRRCTTYSEKFACPEHGVSLAELAPRMFSFNSPHGACPRLHGLGATLEVDPELVVPDPVLSIRDGALAPWNVVGLELLRAGARGDRRPLRGAARDGPGASSRAEQRDLFLHGTGGEKVYVTYKNRYGRKRSYMTAFEGVVANLQRRYRETAVAAPEGAHRGVHDAAAVPGLRRRAPAAGGARRHGRRAQHRRHLAPARCTRRSAWVRRARADRHRAPDRRARRSARSASASAFLDDVGVGYLSLDRAAAHALGRRGAAHPARDADRLAAWSACSTSSTSRRSACTSATTRA